ncbi:WD40-repeat-containing domain protein [Pterulicium gracile]|uniref:U three protein 7 n=1 Tax=Pterulicium gracile TaxID=1884261 RepID=A0A5C3R0E5_9AGAR|nr:WD40-repeat-containing domain protein [Pterula gracilis]
MDSLFAKADAIQPLGKKRKAVHSSKSASSSKSTKPSGKDADDHTLSSIVKRTSTPKSLRIPEPSDASQVKKYSHIANKKLRTELVRQSTHNAQAKEMLADAEMLSMGERGMLEVENEMEKTWRVGQSEIASSAGGEAAKGKQEWKLDGGPYKSRYTKNGRHLAIIGKHGHAATFDWQAGTLHTELHLQETCRDITFLHDQSHFAVAQKKYIYIYDRDGVELHCLKSHIEPTRLEFLPYHWLLASVGNAGYLKYQDTSTGQLLVEHRTKLGSPSSMTQNPHNAVIHLGHQNGTVTLWTPNLPHPAVRLLAHMGPVASVSVDPSHEGGRYMATSGGDGTVKVWDCRNWKGAVREWSTRGGSAEVTWSAKGVLAVGSGGSVNTYTSPTIHAPHQDHRQPPLYLTHPIPHRPITSLQFAPFQDILTIGHADGLSSILVPGAGEPNFDSTEADPFENKKSRREREVRGLLEKIQPDLITLDTDFAGSLAPATNLVTQTQATLSGKNVPDVPFAKLPRMERLKVSGKADETEVVSDEDESGDDDDGEKKRASKEEREKRKMRGKGKSLKRYLRKQRKNVIDPTAVAIREKLGKQREQKRKAALAAISGEPMEERKPSALDRFKRAK